MIFKEELGERRVEHLRLVQGPHASKPPVARPYAKIAKGWRKFLSARKWADDVRYTSRRESGLDLRAGANGREAAFRYHIERKQTCARSGLRNDCRRRV